MLAHFDGKMHLYGCPIEYMPHILKAYLEIRESGSSCSVQKYLKESSLFSYSYHDEDRSGPWGQI